MSQLAHLYDALEVIGKGSFGTVRKVRQKSDGKILVRKEIEYTSMNSHERVQLIDELRILKDLKHPNIVEYHCFDHLSEKRTLHIYMEYCTGGDLAQSIASFKKDQTSVPEGLIWQVMLHMLYALHKCHYNFNAGKVNLFGVDVNEPPINQKQVVIHRDIKPDNIFLINSGSETIFKLGDFGLAKLLKNENDFAKTYVGTPYYMSPEVLMDNPYSPVCDIWSLGCVLFELCTLKPPFQAKTHLQLQAKIKKGVIPEIPDTYSAPLRSIIHDCITVDPNLRPSCFDLLENLSVKFLRKESELIEKSNNLNEYQKQLSIKNDELNKKEVFLNTLERKVETQRSDLEDNLKAMQKKFSLQKKQLEDELFEQIDLTKKQMDLEAKELRLSYQREFRHVVDNEVQIRLKELISKQSPVNNNGLIRKHSDPSSPASQKAHPGGPRKLPSDPLQIPQLSPISPQYQQAIQTSPQTKRIPLKTRNDPDFETPNNFFVGGTNPLNKNTVLATRVHNNNYNLAKKRMELDRMTGKRHIPDYEEMYLRNRH